MTTNTQVGGNATIFAPIQLDDALHKFNLYIQHILSKKFSHQKLEKICHLALETFIKYSESESFTRQTFEKVKTQALINRSYYLLYLLDQMLKNSKLLLKGAQHKELKGVPHRNELGRELEAVFKAVWQNVWAQYENAFKLQNLKIMIKTWGIIYGDKYQELIRKWLAQQYNVKLNSISPIYQAQLRQIYSQEESKKSDSAFDELIKNIENQEINALMQPQLPPQKLPSKISTVSIQDSSLLQALQLDDQ